MNSSKVYLPGPFGSWPGQSKIFEDQEVIYVGSSHSGRVCSLEYNGYIKWFSYLYLRLVLEEKIRGRRLFSTKKGAKNLFCDNFSPKSGLCTR